MTKKRFQDDPCSIARALDDIGDGWSLLIIRQAMFGSRRFSELQQSLGIARNILTERLARLVDNQVLKKVDIGESGTRYEYRLTHKGQDLFAVLVALRQWGDRWHRRPEEPALILTDRHSGQAIPALQVRDIQGRALTLLEVLIEEGSHPQSADPADTGNEPCS